MKRKISIYFIQSALIFGLLLIGCTRGPDIQYLKSEISRLEAEFNEKNQQIKEFGIIIKNLNLLLSTVYYGSAEPADEKGSKKNFTAFGMMYKDEYYLITAGHCIEYDGVKYANFKFKSNLNGSWVYPELVEFNNDYDSNEDYAIFKHDRIKRGLIIDEENTEPAYVLGNIDRKINIFKNFNSAVEGESGSPVLNSRGKLIGIVTKSNGGFTSIKVVTDALDKLISPDI